MRRKAYFEESARTEPNTACRAPNFYGWQPGFRSGSPAGDARRSAGRRIRLDRPPCFSAVRKTIAEEYGLTRAEPSWQPIALQKKYLLPRDELLWFSLQRWAVYLRRKIPAQTAPHNFSKTWVVPRRSFEPSCPVSHGNQSGSLAIQPPPSKNAQRMSPHTPPSAKAACLVRCSAPARRRATKCWESRRSHFIIGTIRVASSPAPSSNSPWTYLRI